MSETDEVELEEIDIVTLDEEDPPRCRICLDEEGDIVESPCSCQGTQRWVHEECLVRWRMSGGNTRLAQCEICHSLYTHQIPFIEIVEPSNTLQYVYFATILNIIFDAMNLGIGFSISNDSSSDYIMQLSDIMGFSSVLKVVLFTYMVCLHNSMPCALTSILIVYIGVLLWVYTELLHGMLNLSYSILLANAARNIISDVET